jgi:putative transposase
MSEKTFSSRRSFGADFKLRVVVQIVSGQRTIADISREYKIKDCVIARWRDRFLELGPGIFGASVADADRIAELERELGRQHLELEILKKASRRLH